jgi:hypothetical protein
MALKAVRRGDGRRHQFERESAMHYLVRCSPSNSKAADLVRSELKDRYPFSLAHDEIWDCIAPFAIVHADIRASVIEYVRSEFGRHSLHHFQRLIIKLGGDELRDILIDIARDEQVWRPYWAVRPLVVGWGRSDPVVASFIKEVASWDDKKLGDLAGILPQVITDTDACRTRLLSLARCSERVRFDLIAQGFASLGCTAEDTEVVDTLLGAVGKDAPLFDPGSALLTHFSNNARVREYAQKVLSGREPPLGDLARAYENDAEIRAQILAQANPLPVTLRGDIVEIASREASSHPAFERILKEYDIEVDSELKIATSIGYHRYVARVSDSLSGNHLEELVDALQAVGPNLNERRAAAFAGMFLSGHVSDIVPMTEYGEKPMHIRLGGGHGESDSLMALISERWEEMYQAFGAELFPRFGDFGADDGHLWDCLAPHINTSSAARRAFLAFCNETNNTLGLRSLVALAREQASSDLLLDHCWRVFGQEISGRYDRHSPLAVQRLRLEIAYVLRDHFRDRGDVKHRLQEAVKGGRKTSIISLLLFEPKDPLLEQLRYGPGEIGRQFSDWVTVLHLASARSSAEEFVEVALAMINRNAHSIWDFQEITNRAVIERLQHDSEAIRCVKDKLASDPSESEIASLPRYLMAAGALDHDVRARCRLMLQNETCYPVPRAGYDAIDDSTRAVSISLLEVLAPSFSP